MIELIMALVVLVASFYALIILCYISLSAAALMTTLAGSILVLPMLGLRKFLYWRMKPFEVCKVIDGNNGSYLREGTILKIIKEYENPDYWEVTIFDKRNFGDIIRKEHVAVYINKFKSLDIARQTL